MAVHPCLGVGFIKKESHKVDHLRGWTPVVGARGGYGWPMAAGMLGGPPLERIC